MNRGRGIHHHNRSFNTGQQWSGRGRNSWTPNNPNMRGRGHHGCGGRDTHGNFEHQHGMGRGCFINQSLLICKIIQTTLKCQISTKVLKMKVLKINPQKEKKIQIIYCHMVLIQVCHMVLHLLAIYIIHPQIGQDGSLLWHIHTRIFAS